MRTLLFPLLGLGAMTAPLAAQDVSLDLPEEITSTSGLSSAAETLAGQAEERLLIRDLLGKELMGADGETLGTVENFVVVPGGRLVAAVVETSDGARLAVPFAAVKLAAAAEGSPMQLSLPAAEVRGIEALRSLADSLGQ